MKKRIVVGLVGMAGIAVTTILVAGVIAAKKKHEAENGIDEKENIENKEDDNSGSEEFKIDDSDINI